MINNDGLVTINTCFIEAIIGKEELEIIVNKSQIDNISELALISISDPVFKLSEHERAPIDDSISSQFGASLKVQFWDLTIIDEEGREPVSAEIVKKIQQFVLDNEEKKFIINCNAGHSRSAGVGLLVHYTLGGYQNMYDFKTSFNDVISSHYRYAPNLAVLDKAESL